MEITVRETPSVRRELPFVGDIFVSPRLVYCIHASKSVVRQIEIVVWVVNSGNISLIQDLSLSMHHELIITAVAYRLVVVFHPKLLLKVFVHPVGASKVAEQ